jgi:lipopolysaccharide export system permease protein
MLGTRLNRMIFWELVRVFLLSLGTLTTLFVVVGLIQQASQLGLSVGQIARSIPLFVPSTLPLTIPATTLFASCVVYGRLSHDNEVVALKAAGVHLYTVVRPALLLGALTTVATAALYHTTIPRTQQQFYAEVLADPEEVLYNMLRRDRCLRHPSLPYILYVKDVQGKRLIDVVVKRRVRVKDPNTGADIWTGYDFVVRMNEARLRVDPAAGTMSIDPDRFVVYEKGAQGTTASAGPIQMDLPDSVTGKEARQKIATLTWEELPLRIEAVRAERDELIQKRDVLARDIDYVADPVRREAARHELRGCVYQIEGRTRHMRNLEAERFARPALTVSCLVFALIGCPVGVWANRADYLSTFLVCFLPTLLVYYPLFLAGLDLGKSGRVPMPVGCWLADAVMGVVALVLIWRLLRR